MNRVGDRLSVRSYEPGEAIVRLRESSDSLSTTLHEELGIDIVERFDFGHQLSGSSGELVRVKLPKGVTVEKGVEEIQSLPGVAYAQPNHRLYLDEPLLEREGDVLGNSSLSERPNDLHRKLWALENRGQTRGTPGADIEVRGAWATTRGDRDSGPIVAVIDSGVDISHPDLVNNLWVNPGEIPGDGIDNDGNGVVDDVHGYNAYHDNVDLSDGKVHGTHVAGTIGATGNNGFGITGVAQQARLMPIKIFGDVGHTNEATVLRGLAYADRMGARVTANSWGGISSQAMRDAYADSPALHIASAGNSGRNNDEQPHYPGSYRLDNMIAVAATDHKDELGSFSCYGEQTVHLGAPGQDIYSTLPRDRYRSFSGTSMACPHVAGVASLILSQYPEASNEEVKARLLEGTEPLPSLKGKTVSGGRLNASLALESDLTPPGPVADFQSQNGAGWVQLRWKAAGDDGQVGQARRTELRRATQPLREDNFEEGTPLELGETLGPGRTQEFQETFPLQHESRELHYALVSVDNVGNRSAVQSLKATVPPAELIFEDAPSIAWKVDGDWDRVEDSDGSPLWKDSPDGDYGYEKRSSITSPSISIPEKRDTRLGFRVQQGLAAGDILEVKVGRGDGRWRTLKRLSGRSDWTEYQLPLSRYGGTEVQLRFELRSDTAHNADGVSLRQIEVLSGTAPSEFEKVSSHGEDLWGNS